MTTSYGALDLRQMTVWAEEVATAVEEPLPKLAPLEPLTPAPTHMTHEQLLGGGVR
jgi:hypothetical protein